MAFTTRRRIGVLALGFALVPLAPTAAAEKLRVVTTTSDLASIARFIGGDKVGVSSLATGKEDPHHIAAKPSYMMAARKADVWIRTGMELEIGYEGLILDGSRNAKIHIGAPGHLDASVGVLRLEVPTTKVDRSMGDIHPQGNPHYLLDPLNGRIVAKTIAQRLAKRAPQHTAYFTERLAAFRQEIDTRMFGRELVGKLGAKGGSKLWALLLKGKLDQALAQPGIPALGGWLGAMRPHAGTKIVPYHRNWTYFVHRFGLVVPLEVEPKPGIPPSPARLAEVIARVKTEKIKVLLMANYFSRRAPDFVAEQTGISVVECTMFPGGQDQATDYFTVFDNIIQRIIAGFGGTAVETASREAADE
jgi:ABC-type Zn uptake system ZnuABC Zn-binding protein ZnuA